MPEAQWSTGWSKLGKIMNSVWGGVGKGREVNETCFLLSVSRFIISPYCRLDVEVDCSACGVGIRGVRNGFFYFLFLLTVDENGICACKIHE